MNNLIVMIGPRRSGLHAVGNWLIGHFPGRVRFVNDPPVALPPDLSNFLGCYDYDVGPDTIRLRPTLHLLQEQARLLNWKVAASLPWPWDRVARRVLRNFWDRRIWHATSTPPELDDTGDAPPDAHIILFENLTPLEAAQTLPAWLATYRINSKLPPVEKETVMVVLRSPWNCLASTLKGRIRNAGQSKRKGIWGGLSRAGMSSAAFAPGGINSPPPAQFGDLWSAFAKEIVGESRYLDPSHWQVQPLLYDAWITRPDLRAAIAGNLGRPLDDRGLSSAATYGGGSSFDGQTRVVSTPQELNQRWRHFQQHPDMRALIAAPDIVRLSAALGLTVPVRE